MRISTDMSQVGVTVFFSLLPIFYNVSSNMVKILAKILRKCSANFIMDNVNLFEDLLKDKITAFGTHWHNKPQIPFEMKSCKTQEVLSSMFEFSDHLTVVMTMIIINNSIVKEKPGKEK